MPENVYDIRSRELHVLPSDPERDLAVQVVNDVHRGPAFAIHGVHRGPCGVSLVVAGRGRYRDDAGEHLLETGMCYLTIPGRRREVTCDPSQPHRVLHCGAVGREARRLWRRLDAPGVWRLGAMDGYVDLFARILEEARAMRPYAAEACAGLLRALLAIVARERAAGAASLSPAAASWQRCRAIMDRDFARLPSVAAAAAACGVSPAYLTRLCRRHLGVGALVYLHRRKLELARELLSSSDWSIEAIGAHCGYPDASTFSRVCRRELGVPPSRLRAS